MTYIYHGCPEKMIGTVLYPLNELRTSHLDVYWREVAKYSDHPERMKLPETLLPILNCLWSDVLHCSLIHPGRLHAAWQEAGACTIPEKKFFRIPIQRGAHHPVAIMRGRKVELLEVANYREIATVPAETSAWYVKLASEGRFGGHFVGVPHVLVKDSIDVDEVEIVHWSDHPIE